MGRERKRRLGGGGVPASSGATEACLWVAIQGRISGPLRRAAGSNSSKKNV